MEKKIIAICFPELLMIRWKPSTESWEKKNCEKTDTVDRQSTETVVLGPLKGKDRRLDFLQIADKKTILKPANDPDLSKVVQSPSRDHVPAQEIVPCVADRKAARTALGNETFCNPNDKFDIRSFSFRYRRKENVVSKDRRDHRSPIR